MRRSHNDRSREKNSGKNRNTDLKRAGRSVRIGQSIRGAGGSGHDSDMRQQDAQNRERKMGNRQILVVTYCFVALFLAMVLYITRFMVRDSADIINNSYNKRQEVLAKKVKRGDIVSADGKVLAKTITDKHGNDTRYYPYKNMFCHAVGRITNSMTGVELSQCYPLLTSHANPAEQLFSDFKGEKKPGDNVITTLDYKLQKTAYNALGKYRGAVVAMEPSTGKILAMVSKPDYDPNNVSKDWSKLISGNSTESALLNRATQGLYPPGSTFKIMTATEYILENQDSYKKYRYMCKGSDSFYGNRIRCYAGERHGAVDLRRAFAKSCNCSFADIGLKLNADKFRELCEKFNFNKSLSVNFDYKKSSFVLNRKSDKYEVMQTSIGQGKTGITPLENVLISSTIANDGKMMTPYIVDHTENDAGKTVKSYSPKKIGNIIDKKTAGTVKKLMKAVVSEGTGSSLSGLSYKAAGKTGSAEFDSKGTSHAWFVGFAPADKPKIAVSIVVEAAGTGNRYAVPIAKAMFSEYLGN